MEYLTLEERYKISVLLKLKTPKKEIALLFRDLMTKELLQYLLIRQVVVRHFIRITQ